METHHTHTARDPLIDLQYADDTLLLSRSTQLMKHMLHSIQKHAKVYGMELNLDKNKLQI